MTKLNGLDNSAFNRIAQVLDDQPVGASISLGVDWDLYDKIREVMNPNADPDEFIQNIFGYIGSDLANETMNDIARMYDLFYDEEEEY